MTPSAFDQWTRSKRSCEGCDGRVRTAASMCSTAHDNDAEQDSVALLQAESGHNLLFNQSLVSAPQWGNCSISDPVAEGVKLLETQPR